MMRMLEWVCPNCGRDVDPGLDACPFCKAPERLDDAATRRVIIRRKGAFSWSWIDVERGFRFGLGFAVALLACFWIAYAAFYWSQVEDYSWFDKLTGWLPGR